MSNLTSFNIDWQNIEESSFEPLPAGSYAAKVVKSEFKDTKKGDKMLVLTFDVLGNKGRKKKLFENYMFTCKANPKTVGFALGKIKSLAKYLELDFDQMNDTSELHGKPVGIKVKVTSSEKYGEGNAVTSFFDYSEDLLADDETTEEISVDEPDIVDDVVSDEVTPAAIQAMKKAELLAFVKERGIDIVLTGKKLSEVKDDVVDQIFGSETIDEEEDLIIED